MKEKRGQTNKETKTDRKKRETKGNNRYENNGKLLLYLKKIRTY